jgi:hypothetical protein
MAQTNLLTSNPITGWSSNEMWVYTGEFYDADGKFTFAEAIDDLSLVSIDGVNRIANTAAGTNQPAGTGPWNTNTTTASTAGQQATTNLVTAANAGTPTLDFGMGPNNDGWHTFEVRVVEHRWRRWRGLLRELRPGPKCRWNDCVRWAGLQPSDRSR